MKIYSFEDLVPGQFLVGTSVRNTMRTERTVGVGLGVPEAGNPFCFIAVPLELSLEYGFRVIKTSVVLAVTLSEKGVFKIETESGSTYFFALAAHLESEALLILNKVKTQETLFCHQLNQKSSFFGIGYRSHKPKF